ncbi:hypothetical protein ACQKMD_17365 [Viridibacillus sp. NPDC096237]|uniref:hypothetical protein n=1 Tax=Viridibacillus sp. NPDC096237 TaxID=3390721 RepID=UPI003D007E4F
MSLTTNAMKAHLKLKLHAHANMLVYLIVLQIMGVVLFAFSGSGQMGKGAENVSLEFIIYSPAGIFMLSILWIFYVGVTLTRKGVRKEIIPFLGSPRVNSITDIITLIYMGAFLTFTVMLSNYFIYSVVVLFTDKKFAEGMTIFNEPKVFFINALAVFIVSITTAAIGYFVGTLLQISKIFIVVFIVLFFTYNGSKLSMFISNYFYEQYPNFVSFTVFNSAIAIFCFFIANAIGSRMEVKGT